MFINVLFVLVSAIVLSSQTKPEPCNKDLSFCWFEHTDGDDLLQVSGDIWIAQEKSEKPIEQSTEISCLRKLNICAKGYSQTIFGKLYTKVEFLEITSWNSNQITLHAQIDPCEIDTYTINKLDRTVFLMSAPGTKADTSGCKGILGEPKTVIYKLGHK